MLATPDAKKKTVTTAERFKVNGFLYIVKQCLSSASPNMPEESAVETQMFKHNPDDKNGKSSFRIPSYEHNTKHPI